MAKPRELGHLQPCSFCFLRSYANSVITAAETAVLMPLEGSYSKPPWITMEKLR